MTSTLATILFGRNGRVRRELRRAFIDPAQRVRRHPRDVGAWVDLIERERAAGRLPSRTARLAAAHRLDRRGAVARYLDELADHCGAALAVASADPIGRLPAVIDEIVRWKTIVQCRDAHAGEAPYFPYAERSMPDQWSRIIWPVIAANDFTCVLELAPGHGRNTEFLRKVAKTIHLVDVNQSCLDACRSRFGHEREGCSFVYHLTDGTDLPGIADASITFGYSWDSMVHFEKQVCRGYIREFGRVLAPGGRAFLHMSNCGEINPDSDFSANPGSRSDMSTSLLTIYAADAGLSGPFLRPMVGWDEEGEHEPHDFLCTVERPGASRTSSAEPLMPSTQSPPTVPMIKQIPLPTRAGT